MSESSDTEHDAVEKAINMCKTAQGMIDFTAKHLHGLRNQCVTTQELTQKEIRNTESKLVKLFSKQLIAKSQVATDDIQYHNKLAQYPKTEQWLTVVGLKEDVIKGVMQRSINLTSLLEMSEEDVKNLISRFDDDEEEHKKLNLALNNLKTWTELQLSGDVGGELDRDLSWTNYNQASNSPYSGSSPSYNSGRPSISSLPPDGLHSHVIPTSPQSTPSSPVPGQHADRSRYTPPSTPSARQMSSGYMPSSNRRHLVPDNYNVTPLTNLTKSKSHESQLGSKVTSISHESQLANKVTDIDGPKYSKNKPSNIILNDVRKMRRHSNEGSDSSRGPSGHTSPIPNSPIHSSRLKPNESYPKNTLSVPKSPKLSHHIAGNHRFSNTFKITTCDFCHKQMFLGYKCKECKFEKKAFSIFGSNCDVCSKFIYLSGKVCKRCKFKCHRDCASKVTQSCNSDEYTSGDGSPVIPRRITEPDIDAFREPGYSLKYNRSVPTLNPGDSGSIPSSNSSSTSSSPAPYSSPAGAISPSPGLASHQFHYPDPSSRHYSDKTLDSNGDSVQINVITDTNTSDDSNKTLIDSSTSEKTIFLDRVDSMDSQDDPLGHSWNRQNSLSVTLKDWIIPKEDLVFGEKIGTGRFGTVHRGHWHGDVAIKLLNIDKDTGIDKQQQISEFKQEVAMLINKRHDNLILFAGACMDPPAIITSYCSGQTLYNYVRKEKFQINRSIIIASQILQGMGFLHARGIFHKDLKSKNIFLENSKVVIADFGLFNITRLCHSNRKGDWLNISPGWLVYLCPEIIRNLQVGGSNKDLPFSEKSDAYAFGTIWYELLCGDWPFKQQSPESIIWQVGKGIKPSILCVGASKDVKDILMLCWSYEPEERPDFTKLLKAMERLPKKRLDRSPSHPIHLSRSADPVF